MPTNPENPDVAPASRTIALQKKINLYRRLTSSMPLLVTVIVHLLLISIAGVVVVQQNIVGKKKTFEAATANDGAVKQVEHRLQVARRGGASGGATSPVSANRIYSTAAGALTMPEMPDLPSTGSGGFGGFGGMGSGVGLGAGVGLSTSLGGGTGLGGRGFMSLSFLGSTSQNVSKIVFVVDTSTEIMEPRKGGFHAFSIIREQIITLVNRLPPGAQFNVVLFRSVGDDNSADINLYERELVPATTHNKKDFGAWMSVVNTKLDHYGPFSAPRHTGWRQRPVPKEAGLDPLVRPPVWAHATHAALEQKPDAIYVITSNQGVVLRSVDEETLAKRKAEAEAREQTFKKEAAKEGLDPDQVRGARDRAYDKAWNELREINRRLVSQGGNPIVVTHSGRIFDRDVQAELRKVGAEIKLDRSGWSKKDGSLFDVPYFGWRTFDAARWEDFIIHYSRLQRHLVPERPVLNIYLFVAADDKPEGAMRALSGIAKRNGGSFQLLTTKRLEEIKAREEAAARKGF